MYALHIISPNISTKLLVVLILCIFQELSPLPKFNNYKTKAGLPSNVIYSCIKDSRGFIWIGTDNGLCRYDGVTFRKIPYGKNSPNHIEEKVITGFFQYTRDVMLLVSMSGNLISYNYSDGRFTLLNNNYKYLKERQISSVYRDSHSMIWFATDRGLIKANDKFHFVAEYIIKDTLIGPSNSNRINSVYEDRNGIFWLAMFYRGLMRFDPVKGDFSQKEFKGIISNIQVREIKGDKRSDNIFIASNGEGLISINYKNFQYKKYKFSAGNKNGIPSDQINSIAFQNDSCLWLGCREGLVKFNTQTGKGILFQHHPDKPHTIVNNSINYLFIDNQEILWVCTSGGFSKFDLLPERFIKICNNSEDNNTPRSNIVNFIIEDPQKNIWLGTSKGVTIFNEKENKYFHYKIHKDHSYLANEEMVKAFITNKNRVWLGTWGGGILRCNLPPNFKAGDNLTFKNFYSDTSKSSSLSSNFIRSINEDKEGNLYISTWNGGLNIIPVKEIEKDNISFIVIKAAKNSSEGLASNYISDIFFDKGGNFWVCSGIGLQRINFQNNKYSLFQIRKNSAESKLNMPTALLKTRDNKIWHGTFGGLVLINNPEDESPNFEIIYENENKGIYSLVEDINGKIWFSTTDSEIGYYDPSRKILRFFSMSEEVDGFDFYFGYPHVTSDGTVYFNGNSGYIKFNPKNLPGNSFAPPVYITSIKVNGEEINRNCDISEVREIELDYDERNLVINFASLNLRHSDNNQYKYILKYHNKAWVSTGTSREINFANLSSGEYLLKIIGSNNDGLWNYNPALLKIIVSPPFWASNFFRVLLLLIVLSGTYLFFNSKIKNLRKEKDLQNNFSKLLIESQEEERKRLSKELHDSLGQNLLVVINRVKMYQNSGVHNYEELTTISDLVSESISEVREISSNLHPHQLERLGLKKAIISMAKKMSEAADIEIVTELEEMESLIPREREINIYRIIQESLNNIVKHSLATKAFIGIKNEESCFVISVSDNGKGFDLKDYEFRNSDARGLGLKSMQERAKLINAEFMISSSTKGTEITLKISC
ncbi:MAG: two-component regulator propeller domain-containing protein [Ignavibacteriaceae bacterium]